MGTCRITRWVAWDRDCDRDGMVEEGGRGYLDALVLVGPRNSFLTACTPPPAPTRPTTHRPTPSNPPHQIVKICRSVLPVTDYYDGDNFFTTQPPPTNGTNDASSSSAAAAISSSSSSAAAASSSSSNGAGELAQRVATPLLLALAVVEISDVVFAVDSIPAVFGVTLDPFIVYSSNMFAILSLRSLYSFVSTIMSELRFLDKAVALVLAFIGGKMVAEFCGVEVPTDVSLLVVGVMLGGGVAASLMLPEEEKVE